MIGRRRIQPGPGQESVWDYPRPPALEPVSDRIRVVFAGAAVADTGSAYRVLETSHPPVYYIPPADIRPGLLSPAAGSSFCEFKGVASYWDLTADSRRAERAAWSYGNPTQRFRALKDYVAFYPSRVDECWVGDEQAEAQAGDFYGGWIISRVVGPFKGGHGTSGW